MLTDPKISASPPFGVVVLPSYNSGTKLLETVAAAVKSWQPVWVVVDGSSDGSDRAVRELAGTTSGIEVLQRKANGGKGAAVLDALRRARDSGIARALVMDADGQHPADAIVEFFRLARENPDALILGQPIFGPDAPALRVHGRRAGNYFTRVNTGWANVADSLFGFRVYPVAETAAIMEGIRTARRYDFDTEIVVRLCWAGFRPINVPVPVRYFCRAEGGSTYFRYVRDNVLLVRTHARLFFGMLARLPQIISQRRKAEAA
jgi:glycosyltransferase involved in cell wall biosynthesis